MAHEVRRWARGGAPVVAFGFVFLCALQLSARTPEENERGFLKHCVNANRNDRNLLRTIGYAPREFTLEACKRVFAEMYAETGFDGTAGDAQDIRAPPEKKFKDITLLKYFPNQTGVAINHQLITDISPLAELTKLENIFLDYNQIEDISPLRKLPIVHLWVNGNRIRSIAVLKQLPSLRKLGIGNNPIKDYRPLRHLRDLESLQLSNSPGFDRVAVSQNTKLTHLSLGNCSITDLEFLRPLTEMDEMWLQDNQITSVAPLAGMRKLRLLNFSNNRVRDFTPLAGIPKLAKQAAKGWREWRQCLDERVTQYSCVDPKLSGQQLNNQGMEYYRAGEYQHAANLFEIAVSKDESYTRARYNLACMLALLFDADKCPVEDDLERALRQLAQVIERDPKSSAKAAKDSDWKKVRPYPGFQRLVGADLSSPEVVELMLVGVGTWHHHGSSRTIRFSKDGRFELRGGDADTEGKFVVGDGGEIGLELGDGGSERITLSKSGYFDLGDRRYRAFPRCR